jgi:hypothetical protein
MILMAGGSCPARYAGKRESLMEMLIDAPGNCPCKEGRHR